MRKYLTSLYYYIPYYTTTVRLNQSYSDNEQKIDKIYTLYRLNRTVNSIINTTLATFISCTYH